MKPYSFETTGRNRATLITLILVWGALILAVTQLEAAPWLMGVLGLFTLPALYDLISARRSGLRLGSDGLSFFSGRRKGTITWDQISHLRLDTRLDLSIRTTVVLITGRKIRLPLETTPPADLFETELTERGIKVERHHFSLMG
ncbi:hypothetical protein [uncultured Tateyamaria sp.]|uniref:hypothetical protein n=1 Tax=uncultured Tateyamaria sp. TaxID=455651 RepID=UPI002636D4E7|nr:hypothetical protein [uncultured Tateyamaria sp.]